ncbi:MAG: phenylacetate--CoA ligase family protein, partial [Gammaproteobacteria bacterium]
DITPWVTGKFVLQTKENADGDSYLDITVELLPGIEPEPSTATLIASSIRSQLIRLNSEFAHYTPPERQLPQVTLRPFADPEYFPTGVKHRYTRR